jgi:hypothetical protein
MVDLSMLLARRMFCLAELNIQGNEKSASEQVVGGVYWATRNVTGCLSQTQRSLQNRVQRLYRHDSDPNCPSVLGVLSMSGAYPPPA